MKVLKPSPALEAGFKKIGEQLTADWLKKVGPDGQAYESVRPLETAEVFADPKVPPQAASSALAWHSTQRAASGRTPSRASMRRNLRT